jgi:predicted ester cyclase
MASPREIIAAFYEQIWNKHDKSKIPELLDESFSFRGSLDQVKTGHEGFAEYLDMVHAAFGDYRCDIQEVIAEEDKAFARMLFSGIHRGALLGYAPTLKRVEWAGAAVFTFKGDKIVNLWVLGDVHNLLKQLSKNTRA